MSNHDKARRVLIVDDACRLSDADVAVLVAAGLTPPERVATLHAAIDRLATHPHGVVLLPVQGPDPALESFGYLLRSIPEAVAIAVAPTRDTDAVLAAMRAGIDEFLVTPIQPSELQSALRRLASRAETVSARTGRSPGRVITVFAAKGGVGGSTVAASLASALSEHEGSTHPGSHGASVALVDFTASGAGLRVMLNIEPRHDLSQLHQRTEVMDEPFIRSILHEQDGVSILAGSASDAPESLPSTMATQLITMLRRLFDYVVIDTDRFLTEQTLAALDGADRILIVAQPEIMALRSAQHALALCVRLGYRDDTVQVIVNRMSERDRLGPEDVQRVLGRPIAGAVPNAYRLCHEAIASGTFILTQARHSALADSFRSLARTVNGTAGAAPAVRRVSGFGALFRRGARA